MEQASLPPGYRSAPTEAALTFQLLAALSFHQSFARPFSLPPFLSAPASAMVERSVCCSDDLVACFVEAGAKCVPKLMRTRAPSLGDSIARASCLAPVMSHPTSDLTSSGRQSAPLLCSAVAGHAPRVCCAIHRAQQVDRHTSGGLTMPGITSNQISDLIKSAARSPNSR